MNKEIQLLKSRMEFYKRLINELNYCNYISKCNVFDKKIKEYQDKLSEVYERIQELKENEK